MRAWILWGAVAIAALVVLFRVAVSEPGGARHPGASVDAEQATEARPPAPEREPAEGRGATHVAAGTSGVEASAEPTVAHELRDRICAFAVVQLCDARARCGCDERPCVDELLADCESRIVGVYEDSDGMVVDEDAVTGCLRSLQRAAESCSVDEVECDTLAVDPARPGQPCASGHRACRGGYCEDGQCRPVRGVGQACEWQQCEHGMECVDGVCADARRCSGGAVASDGCMPPARLDEACRPGQGCEQGACVRGRCTLPDTCDSSHSDCGVGRRCIGEEMPRCRADEVRDCGSAGLCSALEICVEGLCAAAPREGDGCSSVCAPGLYCLLRDEDDEPGRCERYARLASPGEPCGGAIGCDAGFGCSEDETCQPLTHEGGDCTRDACPLGSYCDRSLLANGRCRPSLCAGWPWMDTR